MTVRGLRFFFAITLMANVGVYKDVKKFWIWSWWDVLFDWSGFLIVLLW